MKSISQYIIENKDFQQSFNESQDKCFSEDEIEKIMKDTWNKNGKFYKLLKELDYKPINNDIKDFLEQCLDDDRVAAQFASYISDIIGRDNFSIEQVQKFIKTNDIVG
jgi:hypothetical protein